MAKDAWLDSIAPTTTISLSGTAGENGWYTSAVQVSLQAEDNAGGVGVEKIEYGWNGSDWNTYSTPLTISDEGVKKIYYRATDKAKNVELVQTKEINIDTIAPQTDAIFTGNMGTNSWYVSDVSAVITSIDNSSGSGVDKIEYSFNNSNWNIYSSVFTISEEREKTVFYRAKDKAGNTGTTKNQTIKIDKTLPVISGQPDRLANQNNWYNQNVTVNFTCIDNISGAVNPTIDIAITAEGVGQQASGQCVDKAGNNSSLVIDGINIDKTNPEVSVVRSPEPNDKGWNNTAVIATFVATDSLSNIDGSSSSVVNFNLESADQGASRIFKDKAGNEATASISGVNIDLTAPIISGAISPSANANGWHNTDVAVHFSGSDNLSGIASTSPDITMMNEGEGQETTGTAEDKAGNSASVEVSGIKIDKTDPTTEIVFSGDNKCINGAVNISFTAADNLSGITKTTYNLDGKGWVVYANELNVSSVGNHSLTFKSYDNAGNIENAQTKSFVIENNSLEAAIKFDPDKKDLKVYNIKDGSEATYIILPAKKENDDEKENKQENSNDEKGWILRKYQIKSCSDNLLSVILKYKNEGKELKAEIVSLQYDNAAVINARENKIAVQYSLDKNSDPKELVQNISAKNRFDIGAKYDAKKDQTAISVKLAGIKEKKQTKSGMVILEMVISNSTLKYQY